MEKNPIVAAIMQGKRIRQEIEKLNVEPIARRTNFIRRTPRKLNARQFLVGLVALSSWSSPSLSLMAVVFSLAIGTTYSKQALHKRLTGACRFVLEVAAQALQQLTLPLENKGVFESFSRVLVQDSTNVKLPDRYAKSFPGSRNQHRKSKALLKIQLVMELFSASPLHFSLSGFNRNDQAAAPDILDVARRGDLVLRDLGYFAAKCFRQMSGSGIFFLSRLRSNTQVLDPKTKKPLNLSKILRKQGMLDRQVLLGKTTKVPVRLVALPVPQQVADQRRRLARGNRDKRLNPSREKLILLGWSIFVTNVSEEVWPSTIVVEVYRLRWRIEIIFKVWKSHLDFARLNVRTETLLILSVLMKLIFCLLVHAGFMSLALLSPPGKQLSILRAAGIFKEFSLLLTAVVLDLTPVDLLSILLKRTCFYESRSDRLNFFDLCANLGVILG